MQWLWWCCAGAVTHQYAALDLGSWTRVHLSSDTTFHTMQGAVLLVTLCLLRAYSVSANVVRYAAPAVPPVPERIVIREGQWSYNVHGDAELMVDPPPPPPSMSPPPSMMPPPSLTGSGISGSPPPPTGPDSLSGSVSPSSSGMSMSSSGMSGPPPSGVSGPPPSGMSGPGSGMAGPIMGMHQAFNVSVDVCNLGGEQRECPGTYNISEPGQSP